MMKFLSNKILLLLISVFYLTACSSHQTRQRAADMVADRYNFETKIVKGGQFWLRVYHRITNPALPYVFYVEGDGFAFKNKHTVSNDPTPRHSIMIKLVTMDPRPNVVYIARPCQYIDPGAMEHCDPSVWTRKRMSEEVVASMNEAITLISRGNPIDLVGYSGGGGVAMLIAARNKQVRSIITIAGLLDHKLFTEHHNVIPMIGSLNPIDVAQEVKNIPQLHLSGGKDTIIRASIADKFVRASNSSCVKQRVLPNVSHDIGWEDEWSKIVELPVTCGE